MSVTLSCLYIRRRRTLSSKPDVKRISARMPIKLRVSPKISAPKIAPPPGTAASMKDVFPVPIVCDACAMNKRPIKFGTNP